MYSSFVKCLNSIVKLDEKSYENIKNQFGKNTDLYFEEYILSIDETDYDSYDKVDYYIRVKSDNDNDKDMDISNDMDPNFVIYYNQIRKYPILDQREEKEIIRKIRDLELEFRKNNINDSYLDAIMLKYGFTKDLKHDLESRKIQLRYLCKNINNIDNNDMHIFQMYVDYIDAKEYFYNCNLRLVVFFAKLIAYNTNVLLDSIQNGNIGLMKAIDNYDLDKGTKFSSYASCWIKNYIARNNKYNNSGLKTPYHIIETMDAYKRFINEYYVLNGVMPSYGKRFDFFYDEMKKKGIYQKETEDQKKKIICQYMEEIEMAIYTENVTSLNVSTSSVDDDRVELIDLVEDESVDIEESLNKSVIDENLRLVFNELSNRKICVLLLRNGIKISKYLSLAETKEVFSKLSYEEIFRLWNGKYYFTLNEIALLFSVTSERVRQLESNGIKKIRKYQKRFISYLK